ncbi:MAG: hypothetical protein K9N51_00180 [Candidatus Pacebacteria bacterium]|nr:hypothetical protein [Candidatus Paceibacterota bacterium]
MSPQVFDVGDRKQLFIDDRWFDESQGMSLRVNPPVKHDRVLLPETPWEEMRIGSYSTIIEDEGVYRMWYDANAGDTPKGRPHRRCVCYAESGDGINWRRKNVNLYQWEGITENNIVMTGQGAIMKDPVGPAEHRYKALVGTHENDVWPESKGAVTGYWEGDRFVARMELYLCTSPDGIRWRKLGAVSDYFHDTHNQLVYDRSLRRHVAYVRTHARGRTVGRLEVADPLTLPWIPLGLEREEKAAHFQVAAQTDAADPVDTDLYTPCVHKYPWADDAYFSFTTPYRHYPVGDTTDTTLLGPDTRGRFRNDGPVEVQLGVSRDGVRFSRPDRRPYVPLGLDGAWDGGQLYMCVGMLRKGPEIWMYYAGTSHTHGAYDPKKATREGGIGRLVQRLDGFISADADYRGASFVTPALRFSGAHLRLNVDCSALGEVWVEMRDENGHPIPGYSLDECIGVDRNHVDAAVRWRERTDLRELAGRPIRMHFRLSACKLYAFQFTSNRETNAAEQ